MGSLCWLLWCRCWFLQWCCGTLLLQQSKDRLPPCHVSSPKAFLKLNSVRMPIVRPRILTRAWASCTESLTVGTLWQASLLPRQSTLAVKWRHLCPSWLWHISQYLSCLRCRRYMRWRRMKLTGFMTQQGPMQPLSMTTTWRLLLRRFQEQEALLQRSHRRLVFTQNEWVKKIYKKNKPFAGVVPAKRILLSIELFSTDSSFLYKNTEVAKADCTPRGVVVQETKIVDILAAFSSFCFFLVVLNNIFPNNPTLWFLEFKKKSKLLYRSLRFRDPAANDPL